MAVLNLKQFIMHKTENWKSTSRAASIMHAVDGIIRLLNEPNARIHLLATLFVVAMGLYLGIDGSSWILIIIAIGIVWIAEAFNTALEKVCDYTSGEEWHQLIKHAKDISAAAVLMAAAVSVGIGIYVFLPYLKSLINI